MKVLLLGRLSLFNAYGGDRIQVENTASELKKLGVNVDIATSLDFDPTKYDLCHIFQLDWTPESYLYAKKIKEAKKPLVISPIHHSIREVKRFDDEYVFDYRRISKFIFSDQFDRDVFKNFYRSLLNPRYMRLTLFSAFYGFKKMLKHTLKMSDKVLVQTSLEAKDLESTFDVSINWVKVPNGVSAPFLQKTEFINPLDIQDYIICVGRLEPRKNQLSIIKAVKKLRDETGKDLKLVLVGASSSMKHFEYYFWLNKEIRENDWIIPIKWINNADMPSYYHFGKVCVSASWFETTGLTSLEAILCGTNAVAAGDRAREYLGDYASYCDPGNIDSIKDALKKEYFAPRPAVAENLRHEYTWSNAASKILEVYKELLSKES
jgi:glycosyltransferase involved in cell wall biosynthesis